MSLGYFIPDLRDLPALPLALALPDGIWFIIMKSHSERRRTLLLKLQLPLILRRRMCTGYFVWKMVSLMGFRLPT